MRVRGVRVRRRLRERPVRDICDRLSPMRRIALPADRGDRGSPPVMPRTRRATAMRARLKQETRFTPDEIRAFFDQIAPVIADKKLTVKQGALTRAARR